MLFITKDPSLHQWLLSRIHSNFCNHLDRAVTASTSLFRANTARPITSMGHAQRDKKVFSALSWPASAQLYPLTISSCYPGEMFRLEVFSAVPALHSPMSTLQSMRSIRCTITLISCGPSGITRMPLMRLTATASFLIWK